MDSVFKMHRCGDFAHYLAVTGNIIVYVAFCCNHLSVCSSFTIQGFKKMFKYAPFSPTWYLFCWFRMLITTCRNYYWLYRTSWHLQGNRHLSLSVGLGLVTGRKFILSPIIKGQEMQFWLLVQSAWNECLHPRWGLSLCWLV